MYLLVFTSSPTHLLSCLTAHLMPWWQVIYYRSIASATIFVFLFKFFILVHGAKVQPWRWILMKLHHSCKNNTLIPLFFMTFAVLCVITFHVSGVYQLCQSWLSTAFQAFCFRASTTGNKTWDSILSCMLFAHVSRVSSVSAQQCISKSIRYSRIQN